jgi:thiol:disulfide interchange protein DsbC
MRIPMMRSLIMLAMLLLPMAAHAADISKVEKQIRDQITDLRIDAVRPSPIKGLYEVQSGHNIFYSNATGTRLIAGGHIFDTRTKEDLTEDRLEQINHIDWSKLPLDKAIVSGDPNGMKVAIFTDPDCPFCRRLEQELQQAKGIKVYTFLYPLTRIHPHARQHAESIWCANDKHKLMLDVMLHNANPPKASCDVKGLNDIQALGEKLGIHGTPTLIAGDGRMYAGFKPLPVLEAWLAKGKAKAAHH